MSDKLNSYQTEDLDTSTTSELYLRGKRLLYKSGFHIVPSITGKYGFHRVYCLARPEEFGGQIKYPVNFKVWEEIHTDTQREWLQSIVAGWDEELNKFWQPILKPNKYKSSPLYTYTEVLLHDQGVAEKKNSGDPVKILHSPNPVVSSTDAPQVIKELAPITWIPRKEWFPESLSELKIEDILTIFPPVEAKLLSLILGRAAIGRSNHLPPGYDSPIMHTFRMAALIVGEDPGLGKTTLMKSIFSAMERCGFTLETFDKFNSPFNMGAVVTSDICYRDDMSDDDLKAFVKSGVAKSVISSSGVVKVQDKGVDAFNVFPKSVIFANTNNFNPRLIFGLDPGFADRIKLISTLREAELSKIELSPLSQGTPDVRPFVHLDFLADKLGVDKKVLLLYFVRLCADYALECINNEDANYLEKEVDKLSIRLRMPLHKDSTSQLLSLFIFSSGVRDSLKYLPNAPHHISWADVVRDTMEVHDFFGSRRTLRSKLGESFSECEPVDTLHPFLGYTTLDFTSLKAWVDIKQADFADVRSYNMEYLTNCIKRLRMKTGLSYSYDEVWLVKAYSKLTPSLKAIYELGRSYSPDYYEWKADKSEEGLSAADF